MNRSISWIRYAIAFAGLAAPAVSQQPPPETPFQAVHMLMIQQTGEEKKLLAAMEDINSAIAKGCPACTYHLWKVYGDQSGPFNYMWASNWPGRAIYEKVHLTTEYIDAMQRHPELQTIIDGQIYNRFVEVKPGN